MSPHRSDRPDNERSVSHTADPRVASYPRRTRTPSVAVQVCIVAATVAAVVVASSPVAAVAAAVALVAAAFVVVTVRRAVARAAAREATVRVPGANVEVTVARSSGE